MFKKILIVTLTLALVIGLCACGKKEDTTETSSVAIEGALPYNDDPAGLAGDYMDSTSQRANLTLSYDNTRELYGIVVEWSDSADISNLWMMTGTMNDNNQIEYEDCISVTIDYSKKPEGEEELDTSESPFEYEQGEETINYDNGKGYFSVSDGKLIWDGAADENCKECVFEK